MAALGPLVLFLLFLDERERERERERESVCVCRIPTVLRILGQRVYEVSCYTLNYILPFLPRSNLQPSPVTCHPSPSPSPSSVICHPSLVTVTFHPSPVTSHLHRSLFPSPCHYSPGYNILRLLKVCPLVICSTSPFLCRISLSLFYCVLGHRFLHSTLGQTRTYY